MRVAVIGSAGQLGTDLVGILMRAGDYEVFPFSHRELDCTDFASVEKALKTARPEVVVNCAGYVQVDESEDHPDDAFRVNSLGALNVARSSAGIDAVCVYISTDFVFDGEKGAAYTERDTPGPINVYGVSKLAGEYLVQQTCPRWLITRMASLFGKAGSSGKGGNFVQTILAKAKAGQSLRIVNDVRMSPTYTRDAAQALEGLLRKEASGLFHLVNAGHCTWYEFACKILELAGLTNRVEHIPSSAYPMKARRPKNSSLESTKVDHSLTEYLRPWQQALEAYLTEKELLPSGQE
ncbi:MAG TPA: dTDP-4-dehydrorhamnose reductase [Candidatus Binatia bacterium]|nr:dTDP-4-dehydrorhamnose reductase [Candidatus Binatia bacterium]